MNALMKFTLRFVSPKILLNNQIEELQKDLKKVEENRKSSISTESELQEDSKKVEEKRKSSIEGRAAYLKLLHDE